MTSTAFITPARLLLHPSNAPCRIHTLPTPSLHTLPSPAVLPSRHRLAPPPPTAQAPSPPAAEAAPPSLTSKQRTSLRSLAQRKLSAGTLTSVALGAGGASDGFLEDLRLALRDHEVVKLRMGAAVEKKSEAKALAKELAGDMLRHPEGAVHVVQVVGHTALLYLDKTDMKTKKVVV